MGDIFVGTSGWTYCDWRGRFYPAGVAQRDWLAYYCTQFPTVELNVTTYRLPASSDIERWDHVPPGFQYSLKLSRLITHRRRPGEPRIFVDRFFAAIAPLAPRVANVLAQFPPSFERDDDALAGFLDTLSPTYRYSIEFRHPSWYAEPVFAQLRDRGISLCIHDLAHSATPAVVTGPVLYVRLHGPVRAYAGSYRRKRLDRWARTIVSLATDVDSVYVYFNNDERAFAARNARVLRTQLLELGARIVTPSCVSLMRSAPDLGTANDAPASAERAASEGKVRKNSSDLVGDPATSSRRKPVA